MGTPTPPRARRTATARRLWPPRRKLLRTARTSDRRTGPVRRPAASYRRKAAQQMIAQSRGAAVRHVACPHARAEAQRLLERGATDERGHDRGAEHIATARGVTLRVGHQIGRDARAPHRPPGEVGRAPGPQRHDQRLAAARQRTRRDQQRIGAELRQLFLIQLRHVEAAEPRRRVRQRLGYSRAVGLFPQEQAVQVGVEEAREAAPQQLRRFQVQLIAGDEVDVHRVQVAHLGPQLRPRPGRHAARHLLAAALRPVVAQRDPVVRRRHLQEARAGSHVVQGAEKLVRPGRQVAADLDEWYDLPVVAQRGAERRERVRDAPPLFDRRLRRVATVNRVPHHRADHAQPLHTFPRVCLTNTAAAPYTPAVPVSSPGTIRHTSTAGLNARRCTSARSGMNRRSPARVTPPQMTTTSGLKMLMMLATPAPRNLAVSFTTSRAYSSPSCAASYTSWAVIFERSPFTYLGRDVSASGLIPSTARAAIAGPEA